MESSRPPKRPRIENPATTAATLSDFNNYFSSLPTDVLFFLFRVVLVSDTIDVIHPHPSGVNDLFSLAQTSKHLFDNYCAFLLQYDLHKEALTSPFKCLSCACTIPGYVPVFIRAAPHTLTAVHLYLRGRAMCDHFTSLLLNEVAIHCPFIKALRFSDSHSQGANDSLFIPTIDSLNDLSSLKLVNPCAGLFERLPVLKRLSSLDVWHRKGRGEPSDIRPLVSSYLRSCPNLVKDVSFLYLRTLPRDEHKNHITRRQSLYILECDPREDKDIKDSTKCIDNGFVASSALYLNELSSVVAFSIARTREKNQCTNSDDDTDDDAQFISSRTKRALDYVPAIMKSTNTKKRVVFEIIACCYSNTAEAFLRLRSPSHHYSVYDTGLISAVKLPSSFSKDRLIVTSLCTSAFLDMEHSSMFRNSTTLGEFDVHTLLVDALADENSHKWNILDEKQRQSLVSGLRRQVFAFLSHSANRLRKMCVLCFDARRNHPQAPIVKTHSSNGQQRNDAHQIERAHIFMSLAVDIMSRAQRVSTMYFCDSFIFGLSEIKKLDQVFSVGNVKELQTLSIQASGIRKESRKWTASSVINLIGILPHLLSRLTKNCPDLQKVYIELNGLSTLDGIEKDVETVCAVSNAWHSLYTVARARPQMDVSSLEDLMQIIENDMKMLKT